MMTKWMAKGYLWLLLVLLYSPILIIMIFSFTEAKVLGNWTGFSTKLYSSLFTGGVQRSLVSALWNTFAIAMIAATVSTLLGSIAAIGIFNLRSRTRQVMNFANAIPMMNADIITGVSLDPAGDSSGHDQWLYTGFYAFDRRFCRYHLYDRQRGTGNPIDLYLCGCPQRGTDT